MENFISQLIEQISQFPQWCIYLFTFFSGIAQVAFPPYPGEMVVVMGGCIQHQKLLLEGLILFLTYWSAIVMGNYLLFELGARKGELLLKHPVVAKYINDQNKEKIRTWLSKYGLLVYLTAIYIPGMYLPTVFFSGVMKYRRRYAMAGIMVATMVHDILLFLGGRYLGDNMNRIAGFINTYRYWSIGMALGLAGASAVYFTIKHLRKKAPASES